MLGWDPRKYSEAARRGGNALKYNSAGVCRSLKLLDNITNLTLDAYLVPNAVAFWVFLKQLITIAKWQTGCKLAVGIKTKTHPWAKEQQTAAFIQQYQQPAVGAFPRNAGREILPLLSTSASQVGTEMLTHPGSLLAPTVAGELLVHVCTPSSLHPCRNGPGLHPHLWLYHQLLLQEAEKSLQYRLWHTAPGLQAINGSN